MNPIREKLLNFKRRLSDRKMYSITVLILGLTLGWGIYQYKRANEFRQELDSNYNRAFFDMVGYVQNVETLLVKSMVSTTPNRTALTLKEAWRQANLAQENLGLIPVSQPVLGNTSKFLTQVGDLTYALSNQNLNGTPISEAQFKTIERLNSFAFTLKNSLYDLQGQITSGRLKWGDITKKGTLTFSKTSTQLPKENFENVDKTFKEYPTLIYDGPFSDHLSSSSPKGLTGEPMDIQSAKNNVHEFIGRDKVEAITDVGKDDTNAIKTYTFSVNLKNAPKDSSCHISISQTGGHPIWMLYQRPVQNETLDMNAAKKIAGDFLAGHGFSNMTDTYYLKNDGVATINFAYKQENVTVYSDLVKVQVALDNGEIVGFESKGYFYAHHSRSISQPKISLEEARKKINSGMKIQSFGLAIIPTEYKTEIFVYEFKGSINNRDFLVYINAQNGREENILLIMETPNGVLTI